MLFRSGLKNAYTSDCHFAGEIRAKVWCGGGCGGVWGSITLSGEGGGGGDDSVVDYSRV